MGVYDAYDILPKNQQVKCWWCEMRHVPYACEVPKVQGECIYSIALREGGFANVIDCRLVNISDRPVAKIFDKWGNAIKEVGKGYLFEKGEING